MNSKEETLKNFDPNTSKDSASQLETCLKVPEHENLESPVFYTNSSTVWVDDAGTGNKFISRLQ